MIMTVIAKRLFMPFPLSLYSLLKLLMLHMIGPQKCSPEMYHYLVKIIVKKGTGDDGWASAGNSNEGPSAIKTNHSLPKPIAGAVSDANSPRLLGEQIQGID